MGQVVLSLLNSWKNGSAISRDILSSDFHYIGPCSLIDTDTWLAMEDESSHPEAIEVVSFIVDKNSCALLFEMSDSLTQLKYRVSWFVELQGSRVSRLIEVREPVESFITLKP